MATTKFTFSASVVFAHLDGVRLTKKLVAIRLKRILELEDPDAYVEGLQITRAVVRNVDRD
jgi:hypothetical protein